MVGVVVMNDEMKTIYGGDDDGNKQHVLSSDNALLTANAVEGSHEAINEGSSATHPTEPQSSTLYGSDEIPVKEDEAFTPSANTDDKSPLQSESNVNNASNENSTKSRFRAARAHRPGAIASSPPNFNTSTIGRARVSQGTQNPTTMSSEEPDLHDEIKAVLNLDETDSASNSTNRLESNVLRNTSVSTEDQRLKHGNNNVFDLEDISASNVTNRQESDALIDVEEEGENRNNGSYVTETVDGTSVESPCIVTAEMVTGDTILNQIERRRIVEETIENITNQAVTAEVMNLDGDKPSSKHRAVILILTFIVIVFVVVLVAVLTTRGSAATKDFTTAPTLSPTVYVDPSVFFTIEELYEAVDAYRMSSWNDTNQSSFELSEVAMRYGYPISSWNVSLITNFSRVFDPSRLAPDIAWEFNEDLGNWNVSNAESMMGMFMNAIEFRGSGLENWNVGKVRDFSYMFMNSGFNGTISGWDTSNAEILDSMFATTNSFNDDLSMWDVSRVYSMNSMFYGAAMFEGIGLEYWDVRTVRDFSFLFSNLFVFNGSLSGWNTSSVEIMDRMFADAVIFNDDLSLWDVSEVTDMTSMFSGASAFTGDGVGNWNVSKVTIMENMFSNAILFDGDVSQWDVSRLSTLFAMVSKSCPVLPVMYSCHSLIFVFFLFIFSTTV
jgi:surface protein